ncbi:MAG: glycoside hydrolase family 2, partial [Bacteroidales bacterium]|nr:glycoside hydrolase family 2 [Bacteroidales bacterium]
YSHFSGTVIYRKKVFLSKKPPNFLNLGQVHNISEVYINGKAAGIRWYGNHVYNIEDLVQEGNNEFEIHVITLMGNYMKSLKENPNAQYWTNLDRKNQPLVSMGLIGPVTIYKQKNQPD